MASAEGRRPLSVVLIALSTLGVFFIVALVFVSMTIFTGLKSFRGVTSVSSSISRWQPANPTNRSAFGLGNGEKGIAGLRLDTEINGDVADDILATLMEVKDNDQFIGVLLEVNSPGGSVVASQEIYDFISALKSKKPVVSYVREVAASGAYYSIASSTRIVVNRGSMLGSIGVIAHGWDTSQLAEWLKVRPVTIKTGTHKDTGSPFRAWTEEDKVYLQALLDQTREQFIKDVQKFRPLTPAVWSHLADGRVVLGEEAVSIKLVDQLGTKQDALDCFKEILQLKETPKLFYPEEKVDIKDFVSNLLQSSVKNLSKTVLSAL